MGTSIYFRFTVIGFFLVRKVDYLFRGFFSFPACHTFEWCGSVCFCAATLEKLCVRVNLIRYKYIGFFIIFTGIHFFEPAAGIFKKKLNNFCHPIFLLSINQLAGLKFERKCVLKRTICSGQFRFGLGVAT